MKILGLKQERKHMLIKSEKYFLIALADIYFSHKLRIHKTYYLIVCKFPYRIKVSCFFISV